MTKQDVIELPDQMEPGIDYSGLSGESLIAAKQRLGVGVLVFLRPLSRAGIAFKRRRMR